MTFRIKYLKVGYKENLTNARYGVTTIGDVVAILSEGQLMTHADELGIKKNRTGKTGDDAVIRLLAVEGFSGALSGRQLRWASLGLYQDAGSGGLL